MPDTRYQIPDITDTRYHTPDNIHKIPDARYRTQDTGYHTGLHTPNSMHNAINLNDHVMHLLHHVLTGFRILRGYCNNN